MKKVEVLVVTMNAKNFDLVKKMNIQGPAIIANQDNRNCFEIYKENNSIKMITTNTMGVGRNRNICLLNASLDICVLADDDMIFDKDYEKTVIDAFNKIPDADILIFNLDTVGIITRERRTNTRIFKVNRFNVMNYGAGRIVFRLKSIQKANLFFSLLFGGGCPYSSGEDTLFLMDAIKNKLKIYTYPERIATVTQNQSSWFNGYNDKYLSDKGALYSSLTKNIIVVYLLCFQDAFRHKKLYDKKFTYIFIQMIKGIKKFNT